MVVELERIGDSFIIAVIVSLVLNLYIQIFEFDLARSYLWIFIVTLPIAFLVSGSEKTKSLMKKLAGNKRLHLVFLLILLLLIEFRAGLFSPGPVTLQDYPLHYFIVQNMAENLIPNFQSTIGPTKHFQLSYTLHFDYPMAVPLMTVFLYYIVNSLPLWIVFRFVVTLSFIFPVIALYVLARKWNFPSSVAFLSCLLMLCWTNDHFISGMFSSYFALGFALLGFYFFEDNLQTKRLSPLLFSSLFFSLSVLSNSLVFVPTALTFLVFLIFRRKELKWRYLIFCLFLFVLMIVFYPTAILNRVDYMKYIFYRTPQVFTHLYDLNVIFWEFFFIQSSFIIMLALPIILIEDHKMSRITSPLMTAIILMIPMVFLFNSIQVSVSSVDVGFWKILINAFEIDRIIFFSRPLWSLVSAYLIFFALKILDPIQVKQKLGQFKSRLIWAFLFSSIVFFILPYMIYLNMAWSSTSDLHFIGLHNNNTLGGWFGIESAGAALDFYIKSDVAEIYDFIRYNANDDARILWEESRTGRLGGNIKSLAPVYTNRLFVGGVYVGILLEGNEGAFDGVFFGKEISEYEISELTETLDRFNVGWIVVWTTQSKNFFDSHTEEFELVKTSQSGLLKVYLYSDSPMSYGVGGGYTEVESIDNDEIKVKLYNVSKGEKILLSFRYETDWHAYSENTEMPVIRDGILMGFHAPRDGSYDVLIRYEENLMTKIAKWVSLLTISLTLLFAIFLYKKK